MTLEQLVEIAKIGFPERVAQFIDFENCDIHSMGGVHRLYNKSEPFRFMLPQNDYLAVFIGENKFVQITCGHRSFNHYAAIKQMEKMNLV